MTTMANPCDSCAFRPGCETHEGEPYNRFRAQVAAMSGVPFFCHHGHDYRRPIAIKKGHVSQDRSEPHRLQVCAGWKSQVVKDVPAGAEHHTQRIMRRTLGQQCLELLDAAIAETGVPEKAELWDELDKTFKRLLDSTNWQIVIPEENKVTEETC
jgi:hypothetical protein